MAVATTIRHCEVKIQGIVQGVGFRPFVYRVAKGFELDGTVLNNAQGVTIHLHGSAASVEACVAEIIANPPPLARIDGCTVEDLAQWLPVDGFHIIGSDESSAGATVALSPDMATCEDCLADMADPASRFYRYPFTNCTNCGPRYSIIRHLPYDRQATSMAGFAMCPDCARAYHDPLDRRYHAQPISCHHCGPQLRYLTVDGAVTGSEEAALSEAITALSQGKIIAVKGLGGFHLMCDATNDAAVQLLRARKQRPAKPLAVMVKDEAMARQIVVGNSDEWRTLGSARRPIVLMQKQPHPVCAVADSVAPDIDTLGLFLPYTPLHTLLLEGLATPLVATSANISGEPILTDYESVIGQLAQVVDGILDHDRPIEHPCDDSVVQVINGQEMVLRLGRGYAPLSFSLPEPVDRTVYAAGAQQKNSLAVAFERQVLVSPYIGDLYTLASEQHYRQVSDFLIHCYGLTPEVAVHDLHPDYASTQIAQAFPAAHLAVQHHYAHILGQLAINQRTAPVLGFAFDGTGLGDDGSVWGSEAMVADVHGYRRVASLKPFFLIGGDSAVKDPTRLMLALLFERFSADEVVAMELEALDGVDPRWIRNLHRLWASKAACVACSSMGRLFDAVARLLGLVGQTQFEGEAGMKLSARAALVGAADGNGQCEEARAAFELPLVAFEGREVWDTQALFGQIVAAVNAEPLSHARTASIALGFIQALADAVCQLSVAHYSQAKRAGGEKEEQPCIALCGGVFQNKLLYALCQQQLIALGLPVLPCRQLPVNDASIALGQLWYGIHNEQ
ncbi:hypothetical protein ABT56_20740 [Photobacterium aquae]|uniref:Carbamoyltransferase HypF n=1 Tax=Photobacterium aquae TaxID=1195763 RepID=A0A0J1GTZ5_9GAMM|nr:carbamoyltransferase HypF [Photobacterium aquae]KLV03180.1 hypothetical protein ABT56_20740 [Photobacterium aquae]